MITLDIKDSINPVEYLSEDNFQEVFDYLKIFIKAYSIKEKEHIKKEEAYKAKYLKNNPGRNYPINKVTYYSEELRKINIAFNREKLIFTTNMGNNNSEGISYSMDVFLSKPSGEPTSKIEVLFENIVSDDEIDLDKLEKLNILVFKSYATKLKNIVTKETKLLLSDKFDSSEFYKLIRSGKMSYDGFTNESILNLLIDDCNARRISNAIEERKEYISNFIQINNVSIEELCNVAFNKKDYQYSSIMFINNLLTLEMSSKFIKELANDNRLGYNNLNEFSIQITKYCPEELDGFFFRASQESQKHKVPFGKNQQINTMAFKYKMLRY